MIIIVYKRQQRPFIDRALIGQYGEDITMKYLKDNNIKFEDKRHIKQYQQDEIDFITYAKGKRQTVEVKASEKNIHKYNSIMVKIHTTYDDEKERNTRGNDSYLFRTKSDFLFYIDCVSKDIIVVKTKILQEFLNANLKSLRVVIYQDNEEDASKSKYNRKNTVAYVPLNLIPENGIKRIKTNYKLNLNDFCEFSSKRQ